MYIYIYIYICWCVCVCVCVRVSVFIYIRIYTILYTLIIANFPFFHRLMSFKVHSCVDLNGTN